MHFHANCLMILRGVTHTTFNVRGVSVLLDPKWSSLSRSSLLRRVIKSDCVTGDKPRLPAVNPTKVFLHSLVRDVKPPSILQVHVTYVQSILLILTFRLTRQKCKLKLDSNFRCIYYNLTMS